MKVVSRKRKSFYVMLSVTLLLILGVSSAYAVFRTIDTDDTNLDPNWQASPYVSNDPEESAGGGADVLPTDMDIQNAWLASDATSIYFRIQIYNEVSALTGPIREAWAQIDCDGNGSVNNVGDRWVIYEFHNDTSSGAPNVVYVRSGSSGLPLVLYDDTYGERPTAAADDDQIEWKVDVADLPAACQGNIRVQYHTDNQTDENDDTTVLGVDFGVPTAVTLQNVNASSQSAVLPFALGAFGLVVVSTGLVISRKRKNA
jgi:hypothetical protein